MTDPYESDPYAKSIADSIRAGRQPKSPKAPRDRSLVRAWVILGFCCAVLGIVLALLAQALL